MWVSWPDLIEGGADPDGSLASAPGPGGRWDADLPSSSGAPDLCRVGGPHGEDCPGRPLALGDAGVAFDAALGVAMTMTRLLWLVLF